MQVPETIVEPLEEIAPLAPAEPAVSWWPDLITEQWVIVAGGVLIAFLVGYFYGRRGNSTRPLNRMAKTLTQIAKSLEKRNKETKE